MNPEEFAQLILRINIKDDEQREEANTQITQLMESDPQSFIMALIQIAPNVEVTKEAITLLYSMCRHSQDAFNAEVTAQVLDILLPTSIEIFQNTEIVDNTKFLTGTIISIIALMLHSFQPENTQVNEFLLQNAENDDIALFIMHTITEILYSSSDPCNFEIESLIQLLEKDVIPLQRVKLYFAIASHASVDNKAIQGLFGAILEFIKSSGDIPSCFRVISNFAKEHSLFFRETLDTLINFVAENVYINDDTKREGLYIIQNIAEAEPAMCKAHHEFIEKSIAIFIRIISYVTEETCYEVDINDNNPSSIARSIFWSFLDKINSTKMWEVLRSYIENIEEEENADIVYGIIMTFSYVPLILSSIDNANEICDTLFQLFAMEVLPDHLRYACYCALGRCCLVFSAYFYAIFSSQYIQTFFEQLKECENRNIFFEMLNFIKSYEYFDIRPFNDELLTIIDILMELIDGTGDPHVNALLFDVLGSLLDKAGKRKVDLSDKIDVSQYMGILSEEDEELVAKFIYFFSFVLVVTNHENLKEEMNECFQKSIELIESESISPQDAQLLANAQERMMPFLGEDFGQYAAQIIEEAISVIQNLPEGFEESIFEKASSSGCYVITKSSPGYNYYIENTLIQKYNDEITKLSHAAQILGVYFSEYIKPILENLNKLLSQDMFIEPIHFSVISCIEYIMLSQASNTELYFSLLHAVVEIIQKELGRPFKDYSTMMMQFYKIINTIVKAIKKNPEQLESFTERIISLFEPFAHLKDTLEQRAIDLHENLESFEQAEECGGTYFKALESINLINEVYRRIGKILPEQTAGFMEERIIPRAIELLHNSLLAKNELSTITTFIEVSQSEEKLMEQQFIFEVLTETEEANAIASVAEEGEEENDEINEKLTEISDKIRCVIELLIRLARKIQFSPEIANMIFTIAYILFDESFLYNNSFDFTKDMLAVLLNLMIEKYEGIACEGTTHEETLSFIIENCTSLEEEENDYYYIVLNAICNYIEMFPDEDYENEERRQIIEDLVYNFFMIFGKNESTKHNREIIGRLSILLRQKAELLNVIKMLAQKMPKLNPYLNKFSNEMRALNRAHQQQQ